MLQLRGYYRAAKHRGDDDKSFNVGLDSRNGRRPGVTRSRRQAAEIVTLVHNPPLIARL